MLPIPLRRLPNGTETIDRLDQVADGVLTRWADTGGESLTAAYPVDIAEDEHNLYVEAEAPGFREDELRVTLCDRVLSIIAERRPSVSPRRSLRLHERRYSRIERHFALPAPVANTPLEMRTEDGVLHLTLGKVRG